MSASNRSFARLPLAIFENLLSDNKPLCIDVDSHNCNINGVVVTRDAISLRSLIDSKLQQQSVGCMGIKSNSAEKVNNERSFPQSVTVSQFLSISSPSLLRSMTPLLTASKCYSFWLNLKYF
mmetsp:Transcript_37267/g.43362  ORF Transcript_37267/g.43362 Transcript_37267/m.43362 type:complete len:122 (-) Transcript_37267:893-1258(-)